MQGFLTDYTSIQVGLAYAAGTADRTGATIDTKGWDGVLTIVQLGAIEAGGTNSVKMQQGALSNATDMADLLGTSQTIADDDDGEVVFIDLYRPGERYVRVYVDKDTSHSCAETVTHILYRGKALPGTHGSGVNGEQHNAPVEGTA